MSDDGPPFDGDDYKPPRDDVRLRPQHERIRDLMIDGEWRTLKRIADFTGDPEASVSAQLRHLRKVRFGRYTVNRRYVEHGLYEYQIIAPFSLDGGGP